MYVFKGWLWFWGVGNKKNEKKINVFTTELITDYDFGININCISLNKLEYLL